MERKIGEIFEYNGEWYQCVEQPEKYDKTVCNLCDFHGIGNCELDRCSGTYRSDKKNVVFKKLEKVGEPVTEKGKTFQRLTSNYLSCGGCIFYNENNGCDNCCYMDEPCLDNEIWTEIKQSKEDMEEKKLNLNPFDIQKARKGKSVCTRDGRKARIICFDANIMPGNKNILALIRKDDDSEYVEYYTSNGKFSDSKDDINDLMMLPEKKEGWVNIDWDCNAKRVTVESEEIYDTKEDALRNVSSQTHKDTIKIEWEE